MNSPQNLNEVKKANENCNSDHRMKGVKSKQLNDFFASTGRYEKSLMRVEKREFARPGQTRT
jgi:hypothetical protein